MEKLRILLAFFLCMSRDMRLARDESGWKWLCKLHGSFWRWRSVALQFSMESNVIDRKFSR